MVDGEIKFVCFGSGCALGSVLGLRLESISESDERNQQQDQSQHENSCLSLVDPLVAYCRSEPAEYLSNGHAMGRADP
jgi:hypothetical protein